MSGRVELPSGEHELEIAHAAQIGAAFAAFRGKPHSALPQWARQFGAFLNKNYPPERRRLIVVRHRLLIALGFRLGVLHKAQFPGNVEFANRFFSEIGTRLEEAVACLRGEPERRLPLWAERLCREIAKETIAKEIRVAAVSSPAAFTDGLNSGTDFSRRQSETALFSVLGAIDDTSHSAEMEAMNSRYLASGDADREAYLCGYATGVRAEQFFDAVFDRFILEMDNPKSIFPRRFVMWALWPKFEELKSPGDAFEMLNSLLAGSPCAGAIGDKKSFRKFCERIGYYERSRRVKEGGMCRSAPVATM